MSLSGNQRAPRRDQAIDTCSLLSSATLQDVMIVADRYNSRNALWGVIVRI